LIRKSHFHVWRIRRFVDFMLGAGTLYRIHSPFLYNLIDNVVVQSLMLPGLEPIERMREEYRQSKAVIYKTDYGRNADGDGVSTYQVPLARLARTSLSSRRQALRLHHLAQYLGATRILELGTSIGLTTAYLAKSGPETSVWTLEGCPELAGFAAKNLEKLDVRNVKIIQGRFEEKIGEALAEIGKMDLLFLDGDHRKGPVIANFECCVPHFHNNTVVVIDDIHHSPEMEQAWEHLITRSDVTISLDFFHCGWLLFRKESSKEHFRLRYL
jgi:predicted O-methyltransferase YrrM